MWSRRFPNFLVRSLSLYVLLKISKFARNLLSNVKIRFLRKHFMFRAYVTANATSKLARIYSQMSKYFFLRKHLMCRAHVTANATSKICANSTSLAMCCVNCQIP